jgi:hypothetical protein
MTRLGQDGPSARESARACVCVCLSVCCVCISVQKKKSIEMCDAIRIDARCPIVRGVEIDPCAQAQLR